MADKPGNQTPDTPDVSESEIRQTKVDDLRKEAKDAGVGGTSGMKKDELVEEVTRIRTGAPDNDSDSDGSGGGDAGAGPDGGKLRTGE